MIRYLFAFVVILSPCFAFSQDAPTGDVPYSGVKEECSDECNSTTFSSASDWVNSDRYQEYKAAIKQIESSGRHNLTNSLGYMGHYQFGYQALLDTGMVEKQPGRKNNKDEYIWTDKAKAMGVDSREDFLNNPEAQSKAMDQLSYNNFNYTKESHGDLCKHGIDQESLNASAHFLGPTIANNSASGGVSSSSADGHGNSLSKYLNKLNGLLGNCRTITPNQCTPASGTTGKVG